MGGYARHLAASSALPIAERGKPGVLTSAANCFRYHTPILRQTVHTASKVVRKQPEWFSGAKCLVTTKTPGTARVMSRWLESLPAP